MKFCSSCGGTVSYRIPEGDGRERAICDACGIVHYRNPLVVVGCVAERDGRVLMCKRAIEPRYGYWTVPPGFMERGDTGAGGAARETRAEGLATVERGQRCASVVAGPAGQAPLFDPPKLVSDFGAGDETLEAVLMSEEEIPWDEIAFHSSEFALRKYFEDRGRNRGVHVHEVGRTRY